MRKGNLAASVAKKTQESNAEKKKQEAQQR
jgi:hypothetical protein